MFVIYLSCWLSATATFMLLTSTLWPPELFENKRHGLLLMFVITSMPLAIMYSNRDISKDIRMAERLTWSLSRPIKISKTLLLITVVAFVFLLAAPTGGVYERVLTYFIALILIVWPLLFLGTSITTAVRRIDTTRNYEWRSSLINAGVTGAVGLFAWWLFWAFLFSQFGLKSLNQEKIGIATQFSAIAGIVIALAYGIQDIINHYTLSLLIYLSRYGPWRLHRVLDDCLKLVFLRKVGGGYIFIHRLLLEHFAAMWEAEHTQKVALQKSGRVA